LNLGRFFFSLVEKGGDMVWKLGGGFLLLVAIVGNLVFQITNQESVLAYYLPHEIHEKAKELFETQRVFQIAGVVADHTVHKLDEWEHEFVLTDDQGVSFEISYQGPLPDLFREGQGIVVEGRLTSIDGERLQIRGQKLIASHGNVYDTEKEHHEIQRRFIRQSLLKQNSDSNLAETSF
jgi:cytochrome c-type biogenesis protein CcmE